MSMQPPRMSPPGEAPSSPKKRMSSTSIVMTVLGVILTVGCVGGIALVVVLIPVFRKGQLSAIRRRTCISHLRQIGTSVAMYAEENDDQLPVANRWMDQLEGAGADKSIFRCPEVSISGSDKFGYAINSELSKKKKSKLPSTTWLVVDSKLLERNANSPTQSFPIPGRHVGRGARVNNVLMVDGSTRAEYSARGPRLRL